jgi:hypothetical protein
MILNRRKHPDTCGPDTAVTADSTAPSADEPATADDGALTAALVTALRRRDTPPGKHLKKEEENLAFSTANAAAKNINSSIQGVRSKNRHVSKVRFYRPRQLTRREQALNEPKPEVAADE